MTVPTFIFSPSVQALLDGGIYELVINKATGKAMSIVRDKTTGKIIAHAIEVVNKGININPLFTPLNIGTNLITSSIGMYQNHRGFQKTYEMINTLQQSIGVLQGTMNLIGVGTVTSVALSAVNLHQTLKLKQDIKQLHLEVKDGFIDLKQALKIENTEIIKRIEQVVRDVEYRQHRTILAQAYGRFLQAIECIKDALTMPDLTLRNTTLGNAQKILYDALADYKNPLLDDNSNTPGKLRRKECAWAIEQILIMTYELQGAYETVIARIVKLQENIRQDAIKIIESCHSEIELDFLFPELTRISDRDLLILNNWQHNLDFLLSLSPAEKQDLAKISSLQTEVSERVLESEIVAENLPPEITYYEELKSISHFAALKDNLKFAIKPELRKDYEHYINERSSTSNYPSLAPANWQEIPDITVANLYWYFKNVA